MMSTVTVHGSGMLKYQKIVQKCIYMHKTKTANRLENEISTV